MAAPLAAITLSLGAGAVGHQLLPVDDAYGAGGPTVDLKVSIMPDPTEFGGHDDTVVMRNVSTTCVDVETVLYAPPSSGHTSSNAPHPHNGPKGYMAKFGPLRLQPGASSRSPMPAVLKGDRVAIIALGCAGVTRNKPLAPTFNFTFKPGHWEDRSSSTGAKP
jgi:hypothetical protein